MRKLSLKKLFITLLIIICLFSLWSSTAYAAGVTRLCRYAVKSRTFIRKDITGDGIADKIRIKPKKTKSKQLKKLNVFVNGKKAASIDIDLNVEPCYGYSVNHIVMNQNKVFLQIYGSSDSNTMRNAAYKNCIYQYDNKTQKLKPILDFNMFLQKPFGGWIGMKAHEVVSVSPSQLNVIYRGTASETGRIHCTYTFLLRNGKFKLKSRTASAISSYSTHPVGFNDSYNESFKKNQFIASKMLTFYKKPSSKKVAFSTSEGDILTLKRIRITAQNTFLQFQRGKQLGWISIGYSYEQDWFYGTALRLSVLKPI